MLYRYSAILVPVGALVSRVGDDMAGTAILLFAYAGSAQGDSATVFGLLSVAAAVGGPVFGVWMDRAHSPAPLTLSLIAFTGGLVAIGFCLLHGRGPLAMVIAVRAGLFAPAVAGGWSASLTTDDPTRRRRLALFDASSYSIAGLLGPLLAGLAYVAGGPAAPLIVTVGLLLVGSACAPWTRGPAPARTPRRGGVSVRVSPLADLRSGFGAITQRPRLRWATASSCIAFFGFGMFLVLVPALSTARFGTPAAAGAILAVLAGFALIANAVLARGRGLEHPGTALTRATATVGAGVLLILIPSPVAALLAAAVIGAGEGPQLAALLHIRHLEAPAGLRTQIFTTGASLKITASGLGALAAGPLSHAGLTAPLVVAAAAHLVSAGVARLAGRALTIRQSPAGARARPRSHAAPRCRRRTLPVPPP
jgi:hypothetical protein